MMDEDINNKQRLVDFKNKIDIEKNTYLQAMFDDLTVFLEEKILVTACCVKNKIYENDYLLYGHVCIPFVSSNSVELLKIELGYNCSGIKKNGVNYFGADDESSLIITVENLDFKKNIKSIENLNEIVTKVDEVIDFQDFSNVQDGIIDVIMEFWGTDDIKMDSVLKEEIKEKFQSQLPQRIQRDTKSIERFKQFEANVLSAKLFNVETKKTNKIKL